MLEEILKNLAVNKKVVFNVKVRPCASKTQILGKYGDALKIAVAAAPEKGKANAELTRFLSKTFNLPPASIRIVRGSSSRQKTVEIRK